jgi:hypothetical protein
MGGSRERWRRSRTTRIPAECFVLCVSVCVYSEVMHTLGSAKIAVLGISGAYVSTHVLMHTHINARARSHTHVGSPRIQVLTLHKLSSASERILKELRNRKSENVRECMYVNTSIHICIKYITYGRKLLFI